MTPDFGVFWIIARQLSKVREVELFKTARLVD